MVSSHNSSTSWALANFTGPKILGFGDIFLWGSIAVRGIWIWVPANSPVELVKIELLSVAIVCCGTSSRLSPLFILVPKGDL